MTAFSSIRLHQRSTGHASASFVQRNNRPRLRDLRQQGSAKAMILEEREVVFLNTSGGLTGGDLLDYNLLLGAGARITATTQTAERVYRSNSGAAHMTVTMNVGEGGHLDWLPQETILFEGARARRRTEIVLGTGATCMMAETVVLGRAAMGETVNWADFHDWRMVRRNSVPVHLETLRLSAERLAPSIAGLDGARAFATVVLVAPEAGGALGAVRTRLNCGDVRAAASCLEGRLVIRLMARDGWPLRRKMAEILTLLRRAPLPRVWQT